MYTSSINKGNSSLFIDPFLSHVIAEDGIESVEVVPTLSFLKLGQTRLHQYRRGGRAKRLSCETAR